MHLPSMFLNGIESDVFTIWFKTLCFIFLMLYFSLLPVNIVTNLTSQSKFSNGITATQGPRTQGTKEIATLTHFQTVLYILE